MASSYTRRCRYCDRLIHMRQMPYGQWVPFEGNEPHDCKSETTKKVSPSRKGMGPAPPPLEFDDFGCLRVPRRTRGFWVTPTVKSAPIPNYHRDLAASRGLRMLNPIRQKSYREEK